MYLDTCEQDDDLIYLFRSCFDCNFFLICFTSDFNNDMFLLLRSIVNVIIYINTM